MDETRNLEARLMYEYDKKFVKNLSENQKYCYFLGRMQFLKYELGKENLQQTDCSGSVCLALLLSTGCSIRVTADALYKNYFTVKNPEKDDIKAAFFITLYDRKMGNRLYKEDEVCHVAGICGTDVVLNCVEPYSVLRSLSDMKPFYQANDYKVVVRGLNREALEKASKEGKDLFGADPEFMEYKRIITEEK